MTDETARLAGGDEVQERILLVDDDPANLQVLHQTLDGRGYKLLIAKNGESALSIARKARPDLLLLDIMMPGIDGYEVCSQLRAAPSTSEIPVIFLSALDETKDKVHGFELGAVDYISKPFQAEEVIARVSTHLTIHRLKREVRKQKDELEHELLQVAETQRRLLPKALPEIPGLKLAVSYQTSRYAGGDYYDVLALPDNRWGFLMADVEGHSTPAAVLMAMTCALLRSYPGSPVEPAELLDYLNTQLCKVSDSRMITAFYGVYDAGRRTLRMARAGHLPPLLYRPGDGKTVEVVCEGVIPMGIDLYEEVPVTEKVLQPGDHLLFLSDGITERFNTHDQMYGDERLVSQLARGISNDPKDVLQSILEDVETFASGRPAEDDQTLLLGILE